MGTLEGRTALVTGGSRGIGRAIVLRLAAEGANVVFSYHRDRAAADEVVAEVAGGSGGPAGGSGGDGGRAVAVRADLGSLADVAALFDAVQERFGGLDVLVNNAVEATSGSLDSITEADYDRAMAVNAKGPFFAIQRAGRVLRDGGRIISLSTLNTAVPVAGSALYVGAKGAVEQFTAVAAREYGERGITVNCVSPGATDTDLLRESNPGQDFRSTVAFTALRRLGRPADIANVVAFLAGPDSGWITGQNLRASGGLIV